MLKTTVKPVLEATSVKQATCIKQAPVSSKHLRDNQNVPSKHILIIP